jgi:hypothetical protein
LSGKAAQWPAVAVDGKGTAHVVWQEERAEQEMVPPDHAGDAIHYCQIAERKRSCAGERTLTAPGSDAGGPRVLLTGNTVVVVTTRCCIDADDGGSVTYAFTSSDGGASFSAAMDIGANLLADAELGPGPNAVSTFGPDFAVLPLGGPPDDAKADLTPGSFGGLATNGNPVDSIAFLDAATPIVATSDGARFGFRRFLAGTAFEDAAAWGPFVDLGRGDLPKLASLPDGSKGTYLLAHVPRGERDFAFEVRRWNGTTFAKGVEIGRSGATTSREFFQDAGGRLHAIWLQPRRGAPAALLHRTSKNGTTWSKRACLVAKRYPKRPRPGQRPPDDQFFDLEAAAGPDGSGLIVWDRGAIFSEGPGPVRAKWFDASRPKCPKVR